MYMPRASYMSGSRCVCVCVCGGGGGGPSLYLCVRRLVLSHNRVIGIYGILNT